MKIKEIELSGFKSFLDKTKFQFNAPITTIVGPNGCGKSNVVDAIKWITGELSFKELRGRTMEDLIFAGSDKRPPTSMMEVIMTLDNTQKNAPSIFNEYNEITVHRRIFRDGSSEFFLNKIPCRLRDITDLFLDTGIGQSSYSIIEQGKVGAIVSGRPEDRRLMIEEAAGITKYKSRKKAAERKIEYTKQNLLRVSDITLELKKQIASLERQAKKAEEFRSIQLKAQEIDISVSTREYRELKQFSVDSTILENQQQDLLIQEETRLTSEESLYETKRIDLNEIEKTFQNSQQDLFSIRSVIQDITNQLDSNHRDLQRLQISVQNAKVKDEILIQEISKTHQKIEDTKTQIQNLETDITTLKETFTTKQKIFSEHKIVVTNIETDIESRKGSLFEIVTRQARLDSTISVSHSQIKTLTEELDQLRQVQATLSEEITSKQNLHSEKKESLDKSNQLSFSFEENQKSAKEKLASLEVKKLELEQELSDVQKQLNADVSKLHALQEFTRTYQGYKKSVQSIMKNRDRLGHIQGVLGEMIKPKKGFEKAVQAALSELIECVLVNSEEDIIKVVDYLKNDEKNRGLFLAANVDIKIEQSRIKDPLIVGPLQDFVEVHNSQKDSIRHVLNKTFVVHGSFENLLSLWKNHPYYQFVTLDGDLISTEGVIHAGPWSETPGDLEVRQQIDDLQVGIEPLKATRDDGIIQLNQIVKSMNQTKHELLTINLDLEKQSKINLDLAKEFEKHLSAMELLQHKLSDTTTRIKKLETTYEAAVQTAQSAELEKTEITSTRGELETTISDLNHQIGKARTSYQEYLDELNEYQIKIASILERIDGLKRDYENSHEILKYTQNEKDQNVAQLETHSQEIAHIRGSLDLLEGEKKNTITSLETKEVANSSLQIQHDAAAEEIREIEQRIRHHRVQKETFVTSLNDTRMKISEFALRMENIYKQIAERYQIDLPEHAANTENVSISDELYVESKAQLEKYKEKILKFGNVNLAAIEEVDQLKERYEFLMNQKDDLEKSLQSLIEAIRKINRTTKEKFEVTFAEVNTRFQEIFPRLFRGGKAKLMLTDPENLLETGVDIFAQPPGKKLQSMNLLSGGEKALTAISLLFAIFEYKAPPFCVLDEVDAPLDDANVLRFVSIVKEMSQKTQFIVITHNKNTMEMAHNLYGVTMEEPGLSRTVSVRLHQENVAESTQPILEARSVA